MGIYTLLTIYIDVDTTMILTVELRDSNFSPNLPLKKVR